VLILDVEDPRWCRFVADHPDAGPFHHPAWTRLLAACYGYPSFALAVADDTSALSAGMPAIEVRAPLGGRRLVSLPFTDHCPPLAVSDSSRDQLAAALDAARRDGRIPDLEVRAELPGGQASTDAVIHRLQLQADSSAVFRSFARSQVQRNVRRAERDGVRVRRARATSDLTEVFYGLHLRTRRRLGVPVQPRRFFARLWRDMIDADLGYVLLAELGGVPVAGAVFLTYNRTVVYKYGASDSSFWRVRPNHLLFWEAIRSACEAGYETFDFGRSDMGDTGLRSFKDGWGTREEPLVYATLADRPAGHAAGRLSAAARPVIRRSPLWVCRLLGEALYRYAA
jgi:CelD/BcsL family acetyltransferase involved in cellulose biosynthesis